MSRGIFVILLMLCGTVLFGTDSRLSVQRINLQQTVKQFESYYSSLSDSQRTVKGSGYKPFKRWEWFVSARLNPDGTFPAGARWNVFQEKRRQRSSQPGLLTSSGVSDPVWRAIGPTNIAGRMLDIAFDSNDPNVIWSGAASGGIWRSTDSGMSWAAMDDELPTLAIGCIVTHPGNSNIIYLGTGEGMFNGDAVMGAGVLRSIDGGQTWNTTGLIWELSEYAAVNEMAMHPTNPNILLAATRNGIYRTSNGGDNWTHTLYFESGNEDAKEMWIDPGNPNIVYTALGYPWGDNNNGIYKSTDNGLTWQKLSNGLPTNYLNVGRISLTLQKSNSAILYAGFAGSISYNNAGLYGVYKTIDGGATWTQTCTSPNFYGSQGWYNNVIAADPVNPNVVYSGGVYLYKSINGGVDWTDITNGIHVDQHAIEFHPNDPQKIYVGNDGGMYRTGNGGSTWTSINDGLTTMQFYAMGSDPNNSAIAFGGTQDNGTNRYSGTLTWDHVMGGDGGECNVDYSNSKIVYAEYQNGYHMKSTNGGNSWSAINNGLGSGPWVAPVEMDPVTPQFLYTISNSNLYKTTNGGSNWSLLFDPSGSLGTCIRVAPGDYRIIYVSGSSVIYRSTNAGSSWTDISSGLGGISLSSIAVHPAAAQTLYVASSNWNQGEHVFKSTDGGSNWQNVTHDLPNVPCNSIVIDPDYPEHVYVGTDLGVYLSVDAGSSWIEWDAGFPNVVVDELDIQKNARVLRAATHGRGMWETPLAEALSIIITSPNGDEVWYVNSSHEITWNSQSTSGSVKLEYSMDNGSGWLELSPNTTDDGSYSWAIPNTPSTTCLVRVSDVDGNPSDQSDGVFTIASSVFDISGAVRYDGTDRPVSDATIGLNHSQGTEQAATTSVGTFQFQDAPSGTVVLTPSKTGDQKDAISGSDALLVLQYLAFLTDLSADQQFAADVTEDGSVSGSDAQAILRFLAFYPDNIASTGNWRFLPADTTFALVANASANFNAYLLGDANLSWGASTAAAKAADNNGVALALGAAIEIPNNRLALPILIENKGEPLNTLLLSLAFDSTCLRYESVALTSLSQDFMIVANGTKAGILHIAMAGIKGIHEDGKVLELVFIPQKRYLQNSHANLRLTRVVVNDRPIIALKDDSLISQNNRSSWPDQYRLHQNHPNPFNPATRINYELPEEAIIHLVIFDLHGKIVKEIFHGHHPQGYFQVSWDGRNDQGQKVASGVYLFNLSCASYSETRKMILLK